jgi:hypothetical protein
MNKFPITVTLVSLCIIFGGCIGIVIGRAATRPLVCQTYSCKNGVCGQFKTHCLRVGSDVQNVYADVTETPISTEYVEPTATLIPWDPFATVTRTVTPPFITNTPYPAPETGVPYP